MVEVAKIASNQNTTWLREIVWQGGHVPVSDITCRGNDTCIGDIGWEELMFSVLYKKNYMVDALENGSGRSLVNCDTMCVCSFNNDVRYGIANIS